MEHLSDNDSLQPPMTTLRKLAVKYSRRMDEANDLVQDLLLETVRTGRVVTDENFMPWAHGFLRKQAAFVARTEGRRRERERMVATGEPVVQLKSNHQIKKSMKIKFSDFGVVFNVKDIDRTQLFYNNILGIELKRQPGGDEGVWLLGVLENGVQLIFFEGEESVGRSPVIVFELEEGYIDDLVDEMAKEGADIVTPVTEAPGGWSTDFRDPDGHLLSLYQTENLPRRK